MEISLEVAGSHPKERCLVWKVLKGGLPTNSLRASKGIATSSLCPLCGDHEEYVAHILFDCGHVKDCWQLFGTHLLDDFFSSPS